MEREKEMGRKTESEREVEETEGKSARDGKEGDSSIIATVRREAATPRPRTQCRRRKEDDEAKHDEGWAW